MSDGALSAAISALQAQSKALDIISDNLANSSTVGYKAVDTDFASLVAGDTATTTAVTGGVIATAQQNIDATGTITTADSSTDLAIDGNGLFVVSDGLGGQIYYTRDGEFQESNGYLEVDGYYLMGWPTDASGNITATDTNTTSGLEPIDIDRYATDSAATQNITFAANLPADATAGATFSTSLQVYDSLGAESDIPVTWTKSDTDNEWTLTLSDPTNTSGTQDGTLGGTTTYIVDFNSDGTLASITPSGSTATVSTVSITVASWNDGANTTTDGIISLDLGTPGSNDGLTQYASGESTPSMTNEAQTQDGIAYGTISGVSVGSDGTVTATYSNGQSIDIYKIPIATFGNVDGLEAQSGGVYKQTSDSGAAVLNVAGTGGAGKIDGGYLESSNVDTSTEFSKMIVAQQAYSAASQVITTDKSMFNALIQAMG